MAEPNTIAADVLSKLTGLSDEQHRAIARLGFFPAPKKGLYQFTQTLQGLFRYFTAQNSGDGLTLETAAREFGVSKETLRRGLMSQALETGKGQKYTLAQIWRALGGEEAIERTRVHRANADLKEREKAELDKVTVRLDAVQTLIMEALLPVRQRFLALPSEMASRCNPSDPKLAQAALTQWSDSAMATIREQLPKGKK